VTSLVVTGANGFVGSRIVETALAAGLRVRGTDRQPVGRVAGADYLPADVLEPESLAPALAGADVVVHAAGLAHVFGTGQAAKAPFHAVNVEGTANVARAAAVAGAQGFVLVSSVSVYGPHSPGELDETSPCRPDQPYSRSKLESELRAREVCAQAGVALTILRMATIYGEGDPGNVARLIRAIDRRRFVWVGGGTNRKSLLHRDDAARACIVAAVSSHAGARVYNVSAPVCSTRDVVVAIARALGRRPPWLGVPVGLALVAARLLSVSPAAVERARSLERALNTWLRDDAYDASRIESELGFRTEVDLETGIRREVEWYRRSP